MIKYECENLNIVNEKYLSFTLKQKRLSKCQIGKL